MTDRTDPPAPTFRQALASLAEAVRKVSAPAPLIFEPASSKDLDVVMTPTGPQHILPTRGYADDAGLDLYVSEDIEIGPHEFVDIPSGVKIDIPHGMWGFIVGRSSTLRRRGLLVNPGVIDAGWTGQLFAGIQNLTPAPVHVSAGDRLAQIILLPAPVVNFEPQWGKVPDKTRGESGFGSTGH